MNRRLFMASAMAATLPGAETKLLLPSDKPDEFNFRLMWYSPVPAIDQKDYRLQVKGLVEKQMSFSVADLRRLPHESQNSRMKCVQCWSARADWGRFRFRPLLDPAKPEKTGKAARRADAAQWYQYFSTHHFLSPR